VKLDGASDAYPWQPHIAAYIPPADAIETVNVVTNSFDAEQGIASGSAINAVIKSGSNKFHGAALASISGSAPQTLRGGPEAPAIFPTPTVVQGRSKPRPQRKGTELGAITIVVSARSIYFRALVPFRDRA
jgi:hypothetical protein